MFYMPMLVDYIIKPSFFVKARYIALTSLLKSSKADIKLDIKHT